MPEQEASLATETNNPFNSVPIEVTVSVGRAKPMIRDLVMLGQNAVLELDRNVDDPVELFVADKLIARGHLEESGDEGSGKLCVRLTEIVDLKSGLS
ncbi:MAG: FliM/FliN family flagellar motor switch protein [Halioglobus sp.]